MPIIACKLPAGLKIEHLGHVLTLAGANIGEDLENVSRNGRPNDNARRAYGYGLTELTGPQTEAFEDWKKAVTVGKDGAKLVEPFPALENGSILGPFKSKDEAIKEVATLTDAVRTGMEGLDPDDVAGIEENTDANQGKSARK